QKGTVLWSKNVKADFHAAKGFFGIACSPLIEGNAILVNAGGRDGAGIAALDRRDGKVLWKAANDDASYSSPTAATINGRRYAFVDPSEPGRAGSSRRKSIFPISVSAADQQL